MANGNDHPRGFTPVEKWILWLVFCLLISLSIHLLLFPALLLLSWSTIRWRWQAREQAPAIHRLPTIIAFLAGAGVLWLAILQLRA